MLFDTLVIETGDRTNPIKRFAQQINGRQQLRGHFLDETVKAQDIERL